MDTRKTPHPNKRRPVTFTVRDQLIEQARAFGLNASRAAEQGLESGIKQAREREWLRDNAKAIAAYNKSIEDEGMLITPDWTLG